MLFLARIDAAVLNHASEWAAQVRCPKLGRSLRLAHDVHMQLHAMQQRLRNILDKHKDHSTMEWPLCVLYCWWAIQDSNL